MHFSNRLDNNELRTGFVVSATYQNVSKSYKVGKDWWAQQAYSLNTVSIVAASMAANGNAQLFFVRPAEKKFIMVLFSSQKLLFNLIWAVFDTFRLFILIIIKLFYQFGVFIQLRAYWIRTCTHSYNVMCRKATSPLKKVTVWRRAASDLQDTAPREPKAEVIGQNTGQTSSNKILIRQKKKVHRLKFPAAVFISWRDVSSWSRHDVK